MAEKEKTCRTCRHSWQECWGGNIVGCGKKHGFPKWEPYTNADRIRKMNDDELADWIMQVGFVGVIRLVCADLGSECWYICKHNHFCEKINEIGTRRFVISWLNGEADDYT